MWSSITDIFLPKSFDESIKLKDEKSCVFFGGGTYLVSEKDKNIHKLIDINKLTDDSIEITDDKIVIGSKVNIQELVNKFDELLKLSKVAKFSCSSKNIRNQRTIGGEIAQKRVQSELFTYLVAINPILEIRNPDKKYIHLRDWDGKGIINKIIINMIDLKSSGIERFATLPSAPAFLIVAVVRRALELDFVISGKSVKVYGQTIKLADFSKNVLKRIIKESVLYFDDDQYGSLEYKKALIETCIQRAVEQI